MANILQQPGPDGYALSVTREARTAGLVEEDAEGDPRRLAPVRVYAFDDLLLVVDRDQFDNAQIVELVTYAAEARDSIHQAIDASVTTYGGGQSYRIQLPPADDAGFEVGDELPCHPLPGLLVISPLDAGMVVPELERRRRRQANS